MATRLKVVCAWCGKTMHDGVEPVSHGICRPCLAIHFPEFSRIPKELPCPDFSSANPTTTPS